MANNFTKTDKGINISPDTVAGTAAGDLRVDSADSNTPKYHDGSTEDVLVRRDVAETLTNKTISGANNTLSAIPVDSLNALTANKALTSDGSGVITPSSVTDTELGYVSGVTSAIQTQLDTKALDSDLTTHESDTSTHGVSTVAGISETQVFTNKDIDGGTASNSNRITIPKNTKSNLDALTRKQGTIVYASDVDKLYSDDGSTLTEIGSGSGSGGGINYIDNPDAEVDTTGWATYADSAGTSPVNGTGGSASITWTRSTSSPLRDVASFVLTKDAANRQGEGVSYDFTISAADKAKVLQISFDYLVGSGTFVAGTSSADSDVTVWIYDVTNSKLIQPSSYKLLSNSSTIASQFDATFQTASDSTSYRLIFHVGSTSASAFTLKVDNVNVSPSVYVYGTPITDWDSFTPTGSWVSNTTYTGKRRRVGDSYEYDVLVSCTGAPTAAALTINIGATIDTTKLTGTTADTSDLGSGSALDSGVQNYPKLKVGYNTSTSVIVYASNASGTYVVGVGVSNTTPFTFGSGDSVHVKFTVPIVGLSSSVQMSDRTDTRIVSFVGTQVSEAVTANTTNIAFTLSKDTHGAWSTNTYTVQVPGDYVVAGSLVTNTGGLTVVPYLNGSASSFLFSTANSSGHVSAGSCLFPNLKTGDILSIRSNTSATLSSGSLQIYRLSGPSAIAASESVSALYTGAPPTGTLSNSYNTVTFGTKVKDSHGGYSSGSYTVPISGSYDIAAQTAQVATYALDKFAITAIAINGTATYKGVFIAGGANSSAYPTVNVKSVPLVAGDVITIKTYNDATTPTFASDATTNWFSIVRTGN